MYRKLCIFITADFVLKAWLLDVCIFYYGIPKGLSIEVFNNLCLSLIAGLLLLWLVERKLPS